MDVFDATLQKKRELYQACYALTLQIIEALNSENLTVVPSLIKRRDTLFHRIREADAQLARLSADASTQDKRVELEATLTCQIRDLIHSILRADSLLHQRMRAKCLDLQHELRQAKHRRRLTLAYSTVGATRPKLLDTDR